MSLYPIGLTLPPSGVARTGAPLIDKLGLPTGIVTFLATTSTGLPTFTCNTHSAKVAVILPGSGAKVSGATRRNESYLDSTTRHALFRFSLSDFYFAGDHERAAFESSSWAIITGKRLANTGCWGRSGGANQPYGILRGVSVRRIDFGQSFTKAHWRGIKLRLSARQWRPRRPPSRPPRSCAPNSSLGSNA